MEVSDGTVSTDQDPPPDHRADAVNPDVDLVDSDRTLFIHNTVRVSGNNSRLKQ